VATAEDRSAQQLFRPALAEQGLQARVSAGDLGGVQAEPLEIVGVRVETQADSTLLGHHVADIPGNVGAPGADFAGDVLQRLPIRVVIVLPRGEAVRVADRGAV
jgi:hypothetical protein